MNNILATGESRFSLGNISLNFNFDNESTIIGEFAGKDLKIGSFSSTEIGLQRNFFNTFIGHKAGQNVLTSVNNVYIGNETGINTNGSNNIVLGTNSNKGVQEFVFNSISIGKGNTIATDGMIFGNANKNDGDNIVVGRGQDVKGKNNILAGFSSSVVGNKSVSLGSDNSTSSHRSITIGNDIFDDSLGASNYIAIGNNIYIDDTMSGSNYILIGNGLSNSNSHSMNIGDTIIRYDSGRNDVLFLGLDGKYERNGSNKLRTVIGSTQSNMPFIESFIGGSSNFNTYIQGGIYTDGISIGKFNNNDLSITLRLPSPGDSDVRAFNTTSNAIVYTLPELPDQLGDSENAVLSSTKDGVLYWIDDYTSLIKNTDQIAQGTSNLYYSANIVDQRVDARVNANFRDKFSPSFDIDYNKKIKLLNLDTISNGTSNRHIQNNVYDRDLFVFGTLTVSKLQVLGINVKDEQNMNDYFKSMVFNTSNDLMDTISVLVKRIEELERIIAR